MTRSADSSGGGRVQHPIVVTAVRTASFWGRVRKAGPEECWLWTGGSRAKGYGDFCRIGAHRYSLTLHKGPAPSGKPLALHSCDNPPCVNPAHLRWGTTAENAADMCARGRAPRFVGVRVGSLNPNARLTETQVSEIRASTLRCRPLAEIYGVHENHISAIRRGDNFKHTFAKDLGL